MTCLKLPAFIPLVDRFLGAFNFIVKAMKRKCCLKAMLFEFLAHIVNPKRLIVGKQRQR